MALTTEEKQEALKLYKEGLTHAEIGERINKDRHEVRGYIRHTDEYRRRKNNDEQPELVDFLRRPRKREELILTYDVTNRMLDALLGDLEEDGYLLDQFGDTVCLSKIPHGEKQTLDVDWKGNKIIRFGVLSDTHIGSRWTQITHLHEAYRKFEEEGIKHVYHAGDITEGWKMRQGHEHECYIHGADDYVEEVIDVYPNVPGIKTYFITGNHDLSFVKLAGIDIGVQIAKDRPDMIYLGQEAATVNLTPGCTVELMHPRGGSSYAISYKAQKISESLEGGTKPSILLVGHFHKVEYLFYRNIHIIQAGCIQAQTPFMRGRHLASMVGYWIVELHMGEDGQINRMRPEFFPIYESIEDDYKNWR